MMVSEALRGRLQPHSLFATLDMLVLNHKPRPNQ